MKFTLRPNVLRFRPLLMLCLFYSVALCSIAVLLTACTTVPGNKQIISAEEKIKIQNTVFQQARLYYLEQNYGQAAGLLIQLARQGHRESQYVIGYMYHYGYGVPRNEKESTRWIATAAARGHEKARRALELINAAHDLRSEAARH